MAEAEPKTKPPLRNFATWCKVEAGGAGGLGPIDQIVCTLCGSDKN